MRNLLSFIIFLLSNLPFVQVSAQRHIMLYDPELNQPVQGFRIWTGRLPSDTTNVFGKAAIPEKFDTLLLSKPGYIALRIPSNLVKDTIPVIKDYNSIGEVVVYANRKSDFQEAVRKWTKEDRVEIALQHPITSINFNLSELLSAKRRRDKHNAKRMAKLFDRMDKTDDDPIIHSYRRAFQIDSKH